METVLVGKDILWEQVSNEVVVTNQRTREAFRLTDALAEEFLLITRGAPLAAHPEEREELIARGLVDVAGAPKRLSRRDVVVGGSTVIGASVLAMSLPAAAAASSMNPTFTVPAGFFQYIFVTFSDFTGLEIMNNLPNNLLEISTELFVEDQEWTLTVGPFDDGGGTRTKTSPVVVFGDPARVFLRFLFDAPSDVFGSTVFEGQLRRGSQLSNVFTIPRLVV